MKRVIQVLEAGTVPSDHELIFVKDMNGKWYKFKSVEGCKSYGEAIDQGLAEEVTETYAKSHVWPLSYGSGSLRVVFGIEIVGENSFNKEIKHV